MRLQLKSALGKAKGHFENTRELTKVLTTYGARINQLTLCLRDCRELLSEAPELSAEVLAEIDAVIANVVIKKGPYANADTPDAQAEVPAGSDAGGNQSATENVHTDPPVVDEDQD